MKKFIISIFILLSFFAVQNFAQELDESEPSILIKLTFEDDEYSFPLDFLIPIDLFPDDGKGFGVGAGVETVHCDERKELTCPKYTYEDSAQVSKKNSNNFQTNFSIKFSRKWKKCNTQKKFTVFKNTETKLNLKCGVKITAKFVENSKKEN